jgi:predicted dehydrogenase
MIIGGGMIVHDQILPSLYHLQRLGRLGAITICARREETLEVLREADNLGRAFPGQSFTGTLEPYAEALQNVAPRQIVFVALPDQLHYECILAALACDQHVCTVKPLVLEAKQGGEIAAEAERRGLVVAIDYHKRFDDRSLMARRAYREGRFGEFRLGTACLFEKWYYRRSNFQNWMTADYSDAFTYIGCHYVDLVHFITGLLPVAVSVYGIRDRFPNDAEGYLWTDARVIWNNGACLNVQNALGYPDAAPGSNTQSLTMYCQGGADGGLIAHSDQYRGLKYSYANPPGYSEPSPDYFQYVEWNGPGLAPVGYGYRSTEAMVAACVGGGAPSPLLATAANTRFNDVVIEAGRRSLLDGGRLVEIKTSADQNPQEHARKGDAGRL